MNLFSAINRLFLVLSVVVLANAGLKHKKKHKHHHEGHGGYSMPSLKHNHLLIAGILAKMLNKHSHIHNTLHKNPVKPIYVPVPVIHGAPIPPKPHHHHHNLLAMLHQRHAAHPPPPAHHHPPPMHHPPPHHHHYG